MCKLKAKSHNLGRGGGPWRGLEAGEKHMICEQLMLNTFWGQRTVHDDGCSSYRTYAPLCGGARTEPVCTVRCCRKVRARVRADPNEIEQVTLTS